MDRVNEDEFDYEGDLTLYEGEPFTGIGFELNSKSIMVAEVEYFKGFSNGLVKYWYPDGEPRKVFNTLRGLKHGEEKVFFKGASTQSIGTYEHGIEIEYREWDQNGNLLEERFVDKNGIHMTLLKRHRELYESWINET